MNDFDETRKRDPADRAVVDKLRKYAVERGGTVREVEWDHGGIPVASFVFGWEGDYVVLFACFGKSTPMPHGQVEVTPPETLKELRHLQAVWVVDCNITPDSIRSLPELRHISIHDDGSTRPIDLPAWFGNFPKLERLRLAGHFSFIPYSIVQTGLPFTDNTDAKRGIILSDVTLEEGNVGMYLSNNRELIEAYYHGEQTGEAYAIRECKVIFLGDGGVGKNSLIERIMEDTFQLGKHATEGMRVPQWTTELDGRPFRLRFLDFGGAGDYALHAPLFPVGPHSLCGGLRRP